MCQHKLETIICGTVTEPEVRQTTYYGLHTSPTGIYLLKVNNRNIRTRCEICSKSAIKTPERRPNGPHLYSLKTSENLQGLYRKGTLGRRSGVFIAKFEQISHIALVFPLLTLNK